MELHCSIKAGPGFVIELLTGRIRRSVKHEHLPNEARKTSRIIPIIRSIVETVGSTDLLLFVALAQKLQEDT